MDYYDQDRRSHYHHHSHHHGREREEVSNTKRRRFDKYRVTGLLLMFFGVNMFTLGVFNIAWTASRYGTSCQPDFSGVYAKLCSGSHFYVYAASPLWGGALQILVAFLMLAIHPDKKHHYMAHRRFLFVLAIHMIVILPAIIVLNVLEIYNNQNVYWMYDKSGSLVEYDALQFGLPITIVIMAGLTLNVVLFFLVFMYCCREDTSADSPHHRHSSDRDTDGDTYRGRHWSHDPFRHQHNHDRNHGRYFYR